MGWNRSFQQQRDVGGPRAAGREGGHLSRFDLISTYVDWLLFDCLTFSQRIVLAKVRAKVKDKDEGNPAASAFIDSGNQPPYVSLIFFLGFFQE